MNRRGYVLPFVIVAISASATLALAFVGGALRGHRAGRHGRQAESVALAVDEVMAATQRGWRADSLWKLPPGATVSRTIEQPDGVQHDITWRRSHPLVAWLEVRGTRLNPVVEERAGRRRLRALWLEPPELPLPAALTAAGAVTGEGASTVSGADTPTAAMPCGMHREALDVPPVAASPLGPAPAAVWPAMPVAVAAPGSLASSLAVAMVPIAAHSQILLRDSMPAPLPVSPGWHALFLDGPQVVIQGPAHWRGLLTVRGALRLQGIVHLDGVLVVRGGLDARNAQLRVRGAVLVADSLASPVHLGGDSEVAYDRCAVQMALATVATPRRLPFALWHATGH